MSPAGATLVTGASGFLGRPLVAQLAAHGRKVRVLCRRPEELAGLAGGPVEPVVGSLEEPASYRAALGPGGTVFHLAAVRNRLGTTAELFERVNVHATLELARFAAEAGVVRFVHVSTALVFGPSDGRPRREQDGYDPAPSDPYVASKIKAAEGLRALARAGLPLVIVAPTVVFGPDHPSHPNRVVAHLRGLLRRRVTVRVGDGSRRRSLAYLDDVMRGLLAAEVSLAPGEEVILGGEDVSQRELDRRALALAGRRGVVFPVPPALAAAVARLADRARTRRGACSYAQAVRNLRREWRFDSSRAVQRLGYVVTPLDEALRRTLAATSEDAND